MEIFKREMFGQLGNLFYSIAKDQHVAPLQFGELKMLLGKDWLTDPKHLATNSVNEASHVIVVIMDLLQRESAAPEAAFETFARFYAEHHERFSEALKDEIIRTAMAIAEVFPHLNNLQNSHIIKLNFLFHDANLLV